MKLAKEESLVLRNKLTVEYLHGDNIGKIRIASQQPHSNYLKYC